MKRFARGALTLAIWLTVWAALALLVHRELLLPAPWVVVRRLCELAATGAFWRITAVSIGRVLLGVLGAVVLGVATAVACTASKTADALLRPLMTVVKSTPVASFVVLALIWIARDWLPVFIALLMVLPVVWSNVCTGIRSADPALLDTIREVDVVVEGRFVNALRDTSLLFRGSSNQRIVDVRSSIDARRLIEWKRDGWESLDDFKI